MVKTIALICAYNEEKSIRSIINKTSKYVDAVLVVNDGSSDNTSREIKRTKAILIDHKINRGKGEALKSGFSFIKRKNYDLLVMLDADGQHDPKEIPKLIRELNKGYDIIIGTRKKSKSRMPIIRRCTNFITSLIVSLIIAQKVKDSQSGFRVMKTKILKNIELVSKRYDLESEILVKASRKGYKIGHASIKTIYGDETSKIHPIKDTFRFIRLIIRSFKW